MSRQGPPRQGQGHQGPGPGPLRVFTNSFRITGLPRKSYYQYDAFDNEKLSGDRNPRRRIEVFERLQNHAYSNVFSPKAIYDGDAIAYSSEVLSFGNANTFDVNMSERAPREGANQGRGIIRVTLRRVDAAPITFEDLRNLVEGRTAQFTPRAAVALNLIQLIVRQAPNLKYPNNIKAFFCREAGSKILGGGLEVFKGFYQSVRPARRSLLVNIDTSCGVIYQAGPMVEVALNFLGSRNPRSLSMNDGPEFSRLNKFFKGVFITFDHRKGRKRIEALVLHAGSQQFEWNKDKSDGVTQTTTIQAYFREAYNRSLKFPEAVGVKIGGGSIVPIELCVVEPNQRFTRRVPPELTKGMVEFTSDKPNVRLASITRGISGAALDYNASPFVRDAELKISSEPIAIDGKVLTTPPMSYSASGEAYPRFGSWNVVGKQFNEPKSIKCWAVVDYSPNPSRDRAANEKFVRMLAENCHKLGMAITPPQVYINSNGSNVTKDLYQVARQATGGQTAQPDLILVILPPSAPEIRLQVKRYGDVLEGVVTQCVRVDKVARANDQYCNNVAMKINAKLGGVNAIPKSIVLDELKKRPFIIMGADVGHPAPGVHDQPSVASIVVSFDTSGMKYNAYTSVQPPRLETIEQLEHMVYRAIDEWGNENRCAVEKLVFFRDGLSEGEYTGVAEREIRDIRTAIDKLWIARRAPQPKPTITFIVVGKHHHVRFFPKNENEGDKSGNCPAGFVADEGVGNPIAKDFYLLSHGGLLGTSRPSHYIVILDENFSSNKDKLQELAFTLCHAYARATRSVSIPAPVYYADLVCGRANFHFAPELRYDDSSASVVSGGSTFDLVRWRDGFRSAHQNMRKKMFYM